MTKLVHVAVGVIEDAEGNVFIARRAAGAHQGGLWEFPGGKLEAGETTPQALARELREELAIIIEACEPLIQIRHHYPDKSVLLDVYRVTVFRGQPVGNEGQQVQWVKKSELEHYSFPAANKPIIKAIHLPDRLAITGNYEGQPDFEHKLGYVFGMGIRGAIIRIDNLTPLVHHALISAAKRLANPIQAFLQLNTSAENYSLIAQQFDMTMVGLHLNSHQLMTHSERPISNKVLLGASCHNLQELEKAAALAVDYVLLSPVLPTDSHPEAASLGWQAFSDLVCRINIPVYALGGLQDGHLMQAKQSGAQGVAAIRAWWPQ